MNIPEHLKYTKDHEWVSKKDGVATIGITDYAQGELGDIVFVDVNVSELKKGEPFGTIEAVKTVSDLLAPCSGEIIEINEKLEDEPELINNDPYGEGWIVKVKIANSNELSDLLSSNEYETSIS